MKITYAAGTFTPYLYLKNTNFLGDKFAMTIKPGVSGNVGTVAYDIAIDITAQDKIKIDVPVTFSIAW